MATWDDVRRLALALPQTAESTSYGSMSWKVKDKMFVWERPLRQSDLTALGADAPPDGPILGARVADEGVKQALVADEPDIYFTIPHFDGYAAVLVRLDQIDNGSLEQLVTDAWLCRAPKRLAATYLAGSG
jgi:hypothetical protein